MLGSRGGTNTRRAGPEDAAARELLASFGRESERLYGQVFESVAAPDLTIRRDGLVPPHGALLVVEDGEEPVAVGGLRRFDDGIAEIKRMFVLPEHRRRGHGRRLLAELEWLAADLGYERVRLNTGPLQPEAAALYVSAGYGPIGPYTEMPAYSLFFEKQLSAAA